MISLALVGLEKAINAYLKLDPETIARLAALKGKAIKIDITDWHIHFFVLPQSDGIELTKNFSGTPDTTIAGTLFGLFNTGCANGENTALFKNAINVSGDTDLGTAVRDIMAAIDIDWEEHLSTIVGDVVAHKAGVCVQETRKIGQHVRHTLRDNIKAFLQQESRHLPSREQVEQHIKDVDTLQNDVDRASARLEKILEKRKKKA